jgi:hypothetical protein
MTLDLVSILLRPYASQYNIAVISKRVEIRGIWEVVEHEAWAACLICGA